MIFSTGTLQVGLLTYPLYSTVLHISLDLLPEVFRPFPPYYRMYSQPPVQIPPSILHSDDRSQLIDGHASTQAHLAS